MDFEQAEVPLDAEALERAAQLEVLCDLVEVQAGHQSGGWTSLLLLTASIASYFYFAGGAGPDRTTFVLITMVILLFHEAGHWITMKLFGYRNLRMFFIPFFGAGVSGRVYNIDGWKKCVVALAGPVPGIAVSVVLGIVGFAIDSKPLLGFSGLALCLNGFNLLPFLPLDGGQVLQTVLFSRHPVLDLVFRIIAIIALVAISLLLHTHALAVLAFVLFLGLGVEYRLAAVVTDMQRRQLPVTAPGEALIPRETSRAILEAIQEKLPHQRGKDKVLANLALSVFEKFSVRPPGVLASLGLLTVQGTSFLAAAIFGLVFLMGRAADLGQMARDAETMPKAVIGCGTIERRQSADVPVDDEVERQTIIATQDSAEAAQILFQDLTGRLPPNSVAMRFGQSVLLGLPSPDEAARRQWIQDLGARSRDVFAADAKDRAWIRVQAVVPLKVGGQELADELTEHFDCARIPWLIPPWSTLHSIRPEQRTARRAYARAINVAVAYDDPELRASAQRLSVAVRRKDTVEIKRIRRERKELIDRLRASKRDALRAELTDPIEVAVLDAVDKLPPQTEFLSVQDELESVGGETESERAKVLAELARLCGQLPLEDGKPRLSDQAGTVTGGFARPNGPIVTATIYGLRRADVAAAQIVEWLCSKRCPNVRYGFEDGASPGDLDEAMGEEIEEPRE